MINKNNTNMTTQERNSIVWTEGVKTCACCGRDELKGTYRIDLSSGAQYFGSTCAFKQLGYEKETLSVAKSKQNKEYNQVAFLADPNYKILVDKIMSTSIRDRKIISELEAELTNLRENYKR